VSDPETAPGPVQRVGAGSDHLADLRWGDASSIQRLDDPDPLNICRLEPPSGVRAEDAKVDQLPKLLGIDSRALSKLSHG
jgi:hypothetical protein